MDTYWTSVKGGYAQAKEWADKYATDKIISIKLTKDDHNDDIAILVFKRET